MAKKIPHLKIDAFAIVDNHFSGVGHYTLGIVSGLDELAKEGKLTYDLITPREWKDRIHNFPQLQNYRKIQGNPISNERLRRWLAQGSTWWKMDLLLGKGYYYFSSFLSWPTTKASPSTVVVHDITYVAVPECVHEGNREYLTKVVPFSLRNSKNIISVSQFSKDEVLKYYDEDESRITVAYPCVDRTHFYRRSPEEIRAVKAKYDIFVDKYLIAVSNIEPRKNYGKLVDAYLSLPKEITDEYALILIGGGGWNNEEVLEKIQKAKEEGYKIIHPRVFVKDEDIPAFYSGATAHLFPSIYEGFGMPPLEALACGTVTISSNVTSIPESAGDAALYVDPESIKDIQDKIIQAINLTDDERAVLRQKGYDQVSKFSWRKSAEITASVLTGLPIENFKSDKVSE